jgi:hypothetical protein
MGSTLLLLCKNYQHFCELTKALAAKLCNACEQKQDAIKPKGLNLAGKLMGLVAAEV